VTGLDVWGIATAVAGLRGAYDRYVHAHREPVPMHEEAALAVAEFVNNACALDEMLGGLKATPYAARRDAGKDGRVLPALRFVRDRAMHQVALAAGMQFIIRFSDHESTPPALTGASMYWRPLTEIRQPTDGRETTPEYKKRQAAYQDQLVGRDPVVALSAALRFLTEEVRTQGVDIPDHHLLGGGRQSQF
jgi:hypothetical protein